MKIFETKKHIIISAVLAALTFVVFIGVLGHDFVNYDDDFYVTENPHIQSPLSPRAIIWPFLAMPSGYWQPLTLLSLLMDFEIFGLRAFGFHFTNLVFHAANAVLLFLVFSRMTRSIWPSAFVAALFAVHPLHVESVAWVSQRKDVLSTFFWLLTMWAYIDYAGEPKFSKYLYVAAFLILGLLAKPMLVSLPVILLLMDYWPLKRERSFKWLVLEKIPLVIIVGISSVITYVTQKAAGGVAPLSEHSVGYRISNALVSYMVYLQKTFWPENLAAFYPYKASFPVWQIVLAIGLLVGISVLTILLTNRHYLSRNPLLHSRGSYNCRYLMVGWFWFLLSLLPVIGLVSIGKFSMADRYTYVPLIGIFIMIAWGVSEISKSKMLFVPAALVIVLLSSVTLKQVSYWKNSRELFTHAIEVTEGNFLAHNNLALALREDNQTDAALEHFKEAVRINPRFEDAYLNLGSAALEREDFIDAVQYLQEALKLNENLYGAHNNLGIIAARRGNTQEAIKHFSQALKINPEAADVHRNLVNLYYENGQYRQAWDQIKLCREQGLAMPQEMIEKLSAKMPE